jgi:hypothetical protein
MTILDIENKLNENFCVIDEAKDMIFTNDVKVFYREQITKLVKELIPEKRGDAGEYDMAWNQAVECMKAFARQAGVDLD